MTKKTKIALGASGLIVAVGLLFAWQLGYLTAEPEAVNIDSALEAASGTTSTTAPEEVDSPTTQATASVESLAGTWQVEPSEATFVGYRIFEVLSGADFEAVGRTAGVTGQLVADENQVTAVSVTADLTGLTSDSRFRDGQMKSQALETAQFPDATFELRSPISVETIPADGATVAFTATGDLSLHGITKEVTIPIQASTLEGKLIVIGKLEIPLAEFEIEKPTAPAVASVSDVATMELSLVFARV